MNYMKQQVLERKRIDAPEKKRFHLSLKKNRILEQKRDSVKENDANSTNIGPDIYNYRNMVIDREDETSPVTDSQNYALRLSDENDSPSNSKDIPSYYEKNESRRIRTGIDTTVSIDDSNNNSSGEHTPRTNAKTMKSHYRPTPYYPSQAISTIIIESSDSDDKATFPNNNQNERIITLDSDDDSVLNTLKIGKEDPFDQLKRSTNFSFVSAKSSEKGKSRIMQINNGYSRKIEIERGYGVASSSDSSSSTHFSPGSNLLKGNTNLREQKIISDSSSNDEGTFSHIGKNCTKSYSNRSKLNSSNRSKGKSISCDESLSPKASRFGNVTCRSTLRCQTLANPYNSVKLTKKDAEGIFKGIKIGANTHWTPKTAPMLSNQETESWSSYSEGPGTEKIINETASELVMSKSNSEDEIISNSLTDLKPAKTHISRFFKAPNQEQQHESLSDRKKNDISYWLMNNTAGSSSSSSIISESNRNSSFGNSSLERFELKHETPNNRGKISKPGTSEKTNSVPRGIERFIYKGKTSVRKNQTPSGVHGLPEKTNDLTSNNSTRKPLPKKSLPVVKDVQNLHIEDCADILDKLYGNVWRNKANAVLTPQTEPRLGKNIPNKERSKTDRKYTSKSVTRNRLIFSSSEEGDDFDTFAKDIRPNFNSTKKKVIRSSFIDDKSPSENSSESFYYTALTNPRESKDNRKLSKPTPVRLSTKRQTVAICESDSDLDDNYPKILDKDLNKKRLSFTENASDSSTSEFDPGEVVPPKPKAKKAPARTSRQTPKSADILGSSRLNPSGKTSNSFLASLSATVPIDTCHPEARIYRDNYKNKKEELCRYLFQLYNKEIFEGKLPANMTIEWNVRMRGTAGFCYNRKSVKTLGGIVRSSRIVLATKILDTPDRLRDTLVHEMCHAAAWLINNVSDGHGPYWKGWASKAMKVFPELPPIKRCHDYKIKTKYTYRCTKCGYSIGRHSKSLNTESKRCGHCYGKFELLVNRTTRSGTTQVATPVQTRTPSGFALYVKENYHTVKKDRRSIKHAEVMRILGQQFSVVKIGKNQVNDART